LANEMKNAKDMVGP